MCAAAIFFIQVGFVELEAVRVILVGDEYISVAQFHGFTGEADDALDEKLFGASRFESRRFEDDDVAALRCAEQVADFVNNEVFAESRVAEAVIGVEGIAHRGAVHVIRRDDKWPYYTENKPKYNNGVDDELENECFDVLFGTHTVETVP